VGGVGGWFGGVFFCGGRLWGFSVWGVVFCFFFFVWGCGRDEREGVEGVVWVGGVGQTKAEPTKLPTIRLESRGGGRKHDYKIKRLWAAGAGKRHPVRQGKNREKERAGSEKHSKGGGGNPKGFASCCAQGGCLKKKKEKGCFKKC